VSMTNEDTIGGIQFDLVIPAELIPSDLDSDPKTFDAVEIGPHSLVLGTIGGNGIDDDSDGTVDRVRVLIYSFSGDTIKPGSGVIATLFFDIDEAAKSATHELSLDGVTLSDPKGIGLPVTTENGDLTVTETDADNDGYPQSEDCDDDDATVYPGADEIAYDGIDQDCDGFDLTDVDGDGYNAIKAGGDDCDDADETIYPGADEIAYDSIDQDCDGFDVTDVDGDGYDAELVGGDDCDDADPEINPDAVDLPDDGIDQDCDGLDSTSDTGDTGDTGDTENTDGTKDTAGGGSGGCGCATGTPLAPTGIAGLLLFAALIRRRRGGGIEEVPAPPRA